MISFLFDTERFNLSEVKPHFINDCCFGEDFSNWLSQQLEFENISTTESFQEDWGWAFYIKYNNQEYLIGVNGISNNITNKKNVGQWRVMIDKKRSLIEKLLGKNKMASNEQIIIILYEILNKEKSFTDLYTE